MAIYKCGGRKRKDDKDEPLCSYESETSWRGRRCPSCGHWFDCEEVGAKKKIVHVASAGEAVNKPTVKHIATGVDMLDDVLSGGLVPGSVVLLAGTPGGGKSTILTMTCDAISDRLKRDVLYVSSEESVDRVQVICQRLGAYNERLKILSTKNIYEALQVSEECDAFLTVFDSLPNFRLGEVGATAHETVEIARLISEHTQRRKTCSIVINQISKDGTGKGSLELVHHVETELYLYRFDAGQDKRAVMAHLSYDMRKAIRKNEIDQDRLRIFYVDKNRDGEEKRTAFFLMTKEGQIEPLPKISSG